jgi:photoactive yellow protein
MTTPNMPTFQQPELLPALEALEPNGLDELDFGLIGIDAEGIVQRYNALESRLSGLQVARVMGRPLFTVIAPCMNNEMVAGRFQTAMQDGTALDTTIDYVLALRMRPVKVLLRLLAPAPDAPAPNGGGLRYVLILRPA